ncbi:large ribosomal subunit protein bL33m isoform X2 [Sagmatias obliquidens]|uniref:large ribosomal subunit protein bL33m isoform X2 n=1 Tax=Sagmatias obliquidens TaxID=3371155 RepID=UPI000F442854|nr:39S ribosomal protein L33, mitochondrial isoform X2 [Lagenorhynchus obliquidens]
MFLSAVTFAKTKSKTILVKMLSQAGTGFSFNTKRSRLREKLTLLHYDPVARLPFLLWSAQFLLLFFWSLALASPPTRVDISWVKTLFFIFLLVIFLKFDYFTLVEM